MVGRKPGPRKPFKPAFEAQPPNQKNSAGNSGNQLQHDGNSPNQRNHAGNSGGPRHQQPQDNVPNSDADNSVNGGKIHHSDAMINHKPPTSGGEGRQDGSGQGQRNGPQHAQDTTQRKPASQAKPIQQQDNQPQDNAGRQNKPVYQDSGSRPSEGSSDQDQYPYPDAQSYYNYFRGNFDNSAGNGNYYGTGGGRRGGYFSDGGNVDESKNNYGNQYNHDSSYGNRDKEYLGGYSNRLWHQATGDHGGGGNYNPEYDNYNYESSDGAFNNGGSNVGGGDGGYDKNGDYTDYYSSPVDSGTCCHVLFSLCPHPPTTALSWAQSGCAVVSRVVVVGWE